jgi:hypothetical protein
MPFENQGKAKAGREFLARELAPGPLQLDMLRTLAQGAGVGETAMQIAAKQLHIVKDSGMWSLPVPESTRPRERVRTRDADGADDSEWRPATSLKANTPNPVLSSLAGKIERLRNAGRELEIFRWVDGVPCYLGSVAPGSFSLGWLKRAHGGGRYAVDGIELNIAGPAVELAPPPAVAAPALATASGPLDFGSMFLMMLKGQQDMVTALLGKQTAVAPGPAFDPIAMMRTLDEMIARRQIPAPPPAPFDVIRDAIKLGRDSVGRGGNGDGDDDGKGGDPMFGRIVGIADRVTGMIASRITAPATAPGQPPVIGAGSPQPAAPAVDDGPIPITIIERVADELKPFIARMTAAAGAGTPASEVASYVVKAVDDERFQLLAEAAERPQFVQEMMAKLEPLVGPNYRGWYHELAKELQRELAAATADDDDSDDERTRKG